MMNGLRRCGKVPMSKSSMRADAECRMRHVRAARREGCWRIRQFADGNPLSYLLASCEEVFFGLVPDLWQEEIEP
ncbi:hypothetical protein NKDENANG_01299 [Candidatus Entotheonellaceae bacterium PAL068K]